MKLPPESVPLVLFQRTAYLNGNFLFFLLTVAGSIGFLYKASVALKAFLFSSRIQEEFWADMEVEYEKLRPVLPFRARAILDIGCGIAGIDVFLYRHYSGDANLFLIDKTDTDRRIYYGMQERGAFYNSLNVSREVLEMNGVPSASIHIQEATPDNAINFKESFDIILSLLSWGFHYPTSTYLKQAYEMLAPSGVLILDVRRGTSGVEEVKQVFGECTILYENHSLFRVLARKNE